MCYRAFHVLVYIIIVTIYCEGRETKTSLSQYSSGSTLYVSVPIENFDQVWRNVDSASCENASAANANVFALLKSEALEASSFGFSIPPNATITSISVEWMIEVDAIPLHGFKEIRVAVFKIRDAIALRYETTATTYSDNDGWTSFPSTIRYPLSDENPLWGAEWSAEDINSEEFGVSLRTECGNTDTRGYVHCINVTVEFEEIQHVGSTVTQPPFDSTALDSQNGGFFSRHFTIENYAIAGAIIAGLCFLLSCCSYFVAFLFRKNRKSAPNYQYTSPSLAYTDMGMEEILTEFKLGPTSKFHIQDLKIGGVIGEGKYGYVYKGNWTSGTQVACKSLKEEFKNADQGTQFKKEIEILKKLQHPNVGQFFGVFEGDYWELYMIMEYMPRGSLLDYLKKARKDEEQPGWNAQFQMCLDVASGMQFLENEHYIHRDLAARNLLVNDSGTVKLADFGMAKLVYEEDNYVYTDRSTNLLPIRWSAPEVLKFRQSSIKSDVWSFGVVIWEIFSYGKKPYKENSNEEVKIMITRDIETLTNPSQAPNSVEGLLQRCFHKAQGKRSNFKELHRYISTIKTNLGFEEKKSDTIMSSPQQNCNENTTETVDTPKIQLLSMSQSAESSYSSGYNNIVEAAPISPCKNLETKEDDDYQDQTLNTQNSTKSSNLSTDIVNEYVTFEQDDEEEEEEEPKEEEEEELIKKKRSSILTKLLSNDDDSLSTKFQPFRSLSEKNIFHGKKLERTSSDITCSHTPEGGLILTFQQGNPVSIYVKPPNENQ